MRHVFRIGKLDTNGALEAAKELESPPDAEQYIFDFTEMRWVEPFGLLLFASRFRQFSEQRRSTRIEGGGLTANSYAAHMGFFQSLGFKYGNEPGRAKGGLSYIPIRRLSVAELRLRAAEKFLDVGDIVEEQANQFAAVLTQNEAGEVQETLAYSFLEIMRNVVEHSESEDIWFAAQYWRNTQTACLAIKDEGVGIRSTLTRNPNLEVGTFYNALQLAVQPGISGVAFKGARQRDTGKWSNSGYGLYMTSKLCSLGGSFTICSGPSGMELVGDKERKLDVSVKGTLLGLELNLPKIQSLENRLGEFRKQAMQRPDFANPPSGPSASLRVRVLQDEIDDEDTPF